MGKAQQSCPGFDTAEHDRALVPRVAGGSGALNPSSTSTVWRPGNVCRKQAEAMRPAPAAPSFGLDPASPEHLDALTMAVALLDADGTVVAVKRVARLRQNPGADRPDHFPARLPRAVRPRAGLEGSSARAAAGGSVLSWRARQASPSIPLPLTAEKRWFQLRVLAWNTAGGPRRVAPSHITKRIMARRSDALLASSADRRAPAAPYPRTAPSGVETPCHSPGASRATAL